MSNKSFYSIEISTLHPETLSAIAMSLPSICSLYYILFLIKKIENPHGTMISSISCIIHYPWSAGLHLHRAYGKNRFRREFLYKADLTFQHIYSISTRYAFSMKIIPLEMLFHMLCIANIWIFFRPITNPKSKKVVEMLSGYGLMSCTFDLFYRNPMHFYISMIILSTGFFIQHKNVLGDYSSFWFHICLSLPHYYILYGMNLPLPLSLPIS
jgi:hypothetical protein